jgi:hypothetical protein
VVGRVPEEVSTIERPILSVAVKVDETPAVDEESVTVTVETDEPESEMDVSGDEETEIVSLAGGLDTGVPVEPGQLMTSGPHDVTVSIEVIWVVMETSDVG